MKRLLESNILEIKEKRKLGMTLSELARKFNTSKSVIHYHVKYISFSRQGKKRNKKTIKEILIRTNREIGLKRRIGLVPLSFSTKKASLVGHLHGDGGICTDRIFYSNKALELIEEFRMLIKEVYGIEAWKPYWNGTVYQTGSSATKIVNDLFKYKHEDSLWEVPDEIKSCKKFQVPYIRALFDDDGSVYFSHYTRKIRLYSKSLNGLKTIRNLLLGFNINSKIYYRKNAWCHWFIEICGFKNLELYMNLINFSQRKKQIVLWNIIKSYKKFKTAPTEI